LAKILLVVVGLLLAYWILRGYRKRVDKREPPPPAVRDEDMVCCAQCGVHLPRSESIVTRGKFYCSAEHQRLHTPAD
jgi:uncharacterized protein